MTDDPFEELKRAVEQLHSEEPQHRQTLRAWVEAWQGLIGDGTDIAETVTNVFRVLTDTTVADADTQLERWTRTRDAALTTLQEAGRALASAQQKLRHSVPRLLECGWLNMDAIEPLRQVLACDIQDVLAAGSRAAESSRQEETATSSPFGTLERTVEDTLMSLMDAAGYGRHGKRKATISQAANLVSRLAASYGITLPEKAIGVRETERRKARKLAEQFGGLELTMQSFFATRAPVPDDPP